MDLALLYCYNRDREFFVNLAVFPAKNFGHEKFTALHVSSVVQTVEMS